MSVSRNAVYNFLGALVPAAVTLITIPIYLHFLGAERYGLLTLCLVIVGYSQFLNNGISLAVARRIAQASDTGDGSISEILWTALWLAAGLGSLAAIIIYFAATLYFREFAVLSPTYTAEVLGAAPLVALIVPPGLAVSALTGVLQGKERFLALNVVGLVGNLFAFIPIALVYLITPNLSLIIAGSIAGQVAIFSLLCMVVRTNLPLKGPMYPSKQTANALLSFGARMALITIIVVVFNSVDRLVIGSSLGAAAVPAYAIAYGIISRVIMVPHSLSMALFPRFALTDENDFPRLTSASIMAVASITTPILIGLVIVVEPFFEIWIGPATATIAQPIAYALVGGFWLYCLSHMALSMLQATGREKMVSKVLFYQLIPYCIALVICIDVLGVIGAAVAFTARSAVDCGVFIWLARTPKVTLMRLVPPLLLVAATTVSAALLDGLVRYAMLSLLLAASGVWSALNVPDMLRPFLGKLNLFLPRARA